MHRRKAVRVYCVLVAIWSLIGTLGWGGALKPMGHIAIIPAFPIQVTSWPAHELLLEFSGPGFGANALSDVSIESFTVFLWWSALLWSPLLALRWREVPAVLGVVVQILVLLATVGLFFEYGNG